MPKMKTKRAAAKRFTLTGTGKPRHHSTNRRHLLECKSARRMRRLESLVVTNRTEKNRLKVLLPYIGKIK